jgi:hypothetical protein
VLFGAVVGGSPSVLVTLLIGVAEWFARCGTTLRTSAPRSGGSITLSFPERSFAGYCQGFGDVQTKGTIWSGDPRDEIAQLWPGLWANVRRRHVVNGQ